MSYESPLTARYASREMSALFSDERRALVWRKLWVALAKGERSLGLSIKAEQVKELEAKEAFANLERIRELETETRHDVMAHIKAYGEQCPKSCGIIHLGATSAYVKDNSDLILMREALKIVRAKLVQTLRQLACFASDYSDTPCLAYTHLQPAQPTTVGKRAALWLQDFAFDLDRVDEQIQTLPFLGVKGATGTQSSFLELFDGDGAKVNALDAFVTAEMGFSKPLPIAGQTYPRKIDHQLLQVLEGLAVSAHKFGTDLRLLANFQEIEEPFEKAQVGSSAMPHKRNPIYAERLCALARFLMNQSSDAAQTAALQWMERTLDDSANRRLILPQSFMAADAVLNILIHLTAHLQVNEAVIQQRLRQELPFLATERILSLATKRGGDRGALHERLRQLALQVREHVVRGEANPLFDLVAADSAFALSDGEIKSLQNPSHFIGLADQQVRTYLEQVIEPRLEHFQTLSPIHTTLSL